MSDGSAPPRGAGSRRSSCALIGAFMSILDSSIVNVAIPTIMNVFNASTDSGSNG